MLKMPLNPNKPTS